MRKNKVILVSGYKRSGKDFVSTILNSELENSISYSLATPLKDIVATTLGISLDELDLFKNNPEYYSVVFMFKDKMFGSSDFRKILQKFGTEATKKWFGDPVWTDLFIAQDFKEDYIIISDWRFRTEVEEFSKVYDNVITIRINDDNIVNTDMHPSETALDGFDYDYVIDNTAKDSTVLKRIEEVIKEIK